jgi:hypothetical protein
MRWLLAVLLLALGLAAPAIAQTNVVWGLTSGNNVCVYDQSPSRVCVTLGLLNSTSHTLTLTGPGNFSSLQVGGAPVATTSGALINGGCVSVNSLGQLVTTGPSCTAGGGGGTVTPALAGQLAYYVSAGTAVSGATTGTGVLTALGVNTGTAGSVVVNGGALGTPSSGVATNLTGLPVSTGVSGLGTGVAAALGNAAGAAGGFATTTNISTALPSGAAGAGLVYAPAGAAGAASVATDMVGFRNRIINGNDVIDQRNSGAAQTITAGAALAYTDDRFYVYSTGANVTGQQINRGAAALFAYQITGAASVTGVWRCQRIESYSSADMAGGSATFSVDLSDSLLTTVNWQIWYANSQDLFGTIASPTITSISSGSFTITSSLTRYNTGVISIPSGATTGLQVCLSVGAQTSGTFVSSNWQLEPGNQATVFERRLYGVEALLCQRFYQVLGPSSAGSILVGGAVATGSGTESDSAFSFPTPMRSTPVVAIIGTWSNYNTTMSKPSIVGTDVGSISLYVQSSAAGRFFSYNFGGGAAVTLTSEL